MPSWAPSGRSPITSMPSPNRRRGSALVETVLAVPVLLGASWLLVGSIQYGTWKLTAGAAAGAGAEMLAAGATPVRAEYVAIEALHATWADQPVATVTGAGTIQTLTVSLRVPTVWGWLPLSASQTAATEPPGGTRTFSP
jgi:Flp pilus assembly protein TadG